MAELSVKDAEKWFRREDGEPFKVIDRLSFEAREGCVTVQSGRRDAVNRRCSIQ